jgi:signal transduction histidine kinase
MMIAEAIHLSLVAAVGLAFVNYAFSRVFSRRDPSQSRFYLLVSLGWVANSVYLGFAAQRVEPGSYTHFETITVFSINIVSYIFFLFAAKWQLKQHLRHYIPPGLVYTFTVLVAAIPFVSLVFPRYLPLLIVGPILLGVVAITVIAVNYKMHLDEIHFRVARNARMALVYSMYAYGALQFLAFFAPPYWNSGLPRWLPYLLGAILKAVHMIGMISYGEHLIAEYEGDATRLRERGNELTHAHNTKRMVSLLAHELNAEILQLRLIAERQAKLPGHDGTSGAIIPLVEHVNSVITGFLVWYRQSDPRSRESVATVFHVNHVCDAAVLGVKIFLRHGDRIRRQYAANTRVRAGETEVYQALRNVIKNAVEAVELKWGGTKQSGIINIETEVVTDTTGSNVRVTVEDNGSGVPIDLRAKIFQDGFSTKGTEGRGHGLAVAKQFVQRWNGRITVGDATIGGAKFVLLFPHADSIGGKT